MNAGGRVASAPDWGRQLVRKGSTNRAAGKSAHRIDTRFSPVQTHGIHSGFPAWSIKAKKKEWNRGLGMVRGFIFAGMLSLAMGVAPASADELSQGFAQTDRNGDGRLNADEYLAAVVMSFAARDNDRNGLLTRAELPEASPGGIARIDRNGDGMISVGEAAGDRIVRFFDADGDRNGLLTLQELRAYTNNR
jgi:hypothetical protein